MNNPREQAFSARALLVPPSLERCGLGEYLPSTRRTCPALSCPGPIRLRLSPRILHARLRFLTVFYVMSKHRTATQSKPTFPFAVRFPARAVLYSLAVSFFTFRFHLFGAFFFFFFHGTRKENHFIFSLEPNRVFASTGRLGSISWVVCASSLICGVTAGVYIKPLCGREPYPVLSYSASLVCLSIAAQTPRF